MINGSLHKKILYAAAFITGCCFVCSCGNTDKEIKTLTDKSEIQREEATQVESFLSQGGVLKAKLKAPIMFRVNGFDTIFTEFPNTLHVDFYNDSTKIETYLDSKYGKYYENYNKVYLRDSVVIITMKGDTLRSPDMWWDQNSKLFYTDKYAIYHGIGKSITGGTGMVATQDLKSITFRNPTGTVQVSDNGIPK